MLDQALAARLPLITVETSDPLAVMAVLKILTGRDDIARSEIIGTGKITPDSVFYGVGGFKLATNFTIEKAESHFKKHNVSFVLVNPVKHFDVPPNFYVAGEMPTPVELVERVLAKVVDEDTIAEMLPALGGLTAKEVSWLVRLASATDGEITRESLTHARRTAFPPRRGLEQVDTDLGPYIPEVDLEEWADAELDFFMGANDHRLRPRGILLDGKPGTGKTQASKWLANKLQIPLYRFNVADVMNKYVGESEKGITQALAQADREAPCVFLLDEVEKVFGSTKSEVSGSDSLTEKVLAHLLWWLQEHRTEVLTVMTTNAKDRLPPELYREGRIDAVLTFEGLRPKEALELAKHIAASYEEVKLTTAELKAQLEPHFQPDSPRIAQSAVATAVARAVKLKMKTAL